MYDNNSSPGDFVDTMSSGDAAMPAVSRREHTPLANKLTKWQLMNCSKLWMLASGPTHDE